MYYRKGSSLATSATVQLQQLSVRDGLLGFHRRKLKELFWNQPDLSMSDLESDSAVRITLVTMHSKIWFQRTSNLGDL